MITVIYITAEIRLIPRSELMLKFATVILLRTIPMWLHLMVGKLNFIQLSSMILFKSNAELLDLAMRLLMVLSSRTPVGGSQNSTHSVLETVALKGLLNQIMPDSWIVGCLFEYTFHNPPYI